ALSSIFSPWISRFRKFPERKRESKSGKGPPRFHCYILRPLLGCIDFMRQRSRRFCQKICGEFARELSISCLSPRPFFLRQLWVRPEERCLHKDLAVRTLVS